MSKLLFLLILLYSSSSFGLTNGEYDIIRNKADEKKDLILLIQSGENYKIDIPNKPLLPAEKKSSTLKPHNKPALTQSNPNNKTDVSNKPIPAPMDGKDSTILKPGSRATYLTQLTENYKPDTLNKAVPALPAPPPLDEKEANILKSRNKLIFLKEQTSIAQREYNALIIQKKKNKILEIKADMRLYNITINELY